MNEDLGEVAGLLNGLVSVPRADNVRNRLVLLLLLLLTAALSCTLHSWSLWSPCWLAIVEIWPYP